VSTDFPNIASRYPPVLLDQRARVATSGTFRERVRFDLVERAQHAFGLLAAADVATFTGVTEIVAIEFGVAEGAGLLNLAKVAEAVTEETGVRIRLVGFDTGAGMPGPVDFRDHPEIWSAGDFAMPDPDALVARLHGRAELVLGNVRDTVPKFASSLGDAPVGFVSVDLDFYSSTRDALALFGIPNDKLLPVVVTYFDDVIGGIGRIGSLFRNRRAGQLLAVDEFNEAHSDRLIDSIRILRHRRPLDRELWLDRMYALHVLDHPLRTTEGSSRAAMSIREHGHTNRFEWLL
jgi:hypothetical protein